MPRVCPRCRSEYRGSASLCADCGLELVDEVPQSTRHVTTTGVAQAGLEPTHARRRLSRFRRGGFTVLALSTGMIVYMAAAGEISGIQWLGVGPAIVFFPVSFYWAYWGYVWLWDRYGVPAWSGVRRLARTRRPLLVLLILTSPVLIVGGFWVSWIVAFTYGLLGGARLQHTRHLLVASQTL